MRWMMVWWGVRWRAFSLALVRTCLAASRAMMVEVATAHLQGAALPLSVGLGSGDSVMSPNRRWTRCAQHEAWQMLLGMHVQPEHLSISVGVSASWQTDRVRLLV